LAEAKLEQTENGLVPASEGWFVLNAKEAAWMHTDALGEYVGFEGKEARFAELGINLNVMSPGQPMAMYHRENRQEDFLVLKGEAIAIVEGEERRLRAWDLLHCPPNVDHVIVGAGEGPCLILGVGARLPGDHGLVYPANETAQKHGAGAETDTTEPREAYGRFSPPIATSYRDGDLTDL
jgi:uncharacterized cupin superfamily protein